MAGRLQAAQWHRCRVAALGPTIGARAFARCLAPGSYRGQVCGYHLQDRGDRFSLWRTWASHTLVCNCGMGVGFEELKVQRPVCQGPGAIV